MRFAARAIIVLEPNMISFGKGIWLDTGPVRMLGMRLTATMSVLQLKDRGLLVFSPLPLTPERRVAVEAIGTVRHLYAPNLFHHLRIGEWAAAFPEARLHAPPGLTKKRPDLRIDRLHGTAQEPEFAGLVDEFPIDCFRLKESVLVYRPARTLLVADLVHNIGRPEHLWTRIYASLMGFYDCVALSRVIRWSAFADRSAARRSLDRVLEQSFDRLVVGHGDPIDSEARDALARAYSWLPAVPLSLTGARKS